MKVRVRVGGVAAEQVSPTPPDKEHTFWCVLYFFSCDLHSYTFTFILFFMSIYGMIIYIAN